MERVLFIYPALNAQEGFNHGIAALSGALKAGGTETRLIHLNEALYGPLSPDDLAAQVMAYDPHLICFSVMSQQFKYALEIAQDLKRRFPFPLAIGGVHATMVPEEVAATGAFDFIGLGECDEALPALVKALRHDLDTTTIPNIWAKTDEGGYQRNPVGPFPSLTDLPPKDYEIFDLDRCCEKMNGWMSIITSRGCPHRCSYCFNHQLLKRYREEAKEKPAAYLRRYPIDRIINDMRTLRKNHPGIRVFILDDDLFTLDESYVLDFCGAYTESGIDLPFVVNGHVQSFTEPMARALKAAGCKILKFGVESGSERIRRDVLRRNMKDEVIHKAFRIAHEAGLHTSAFLMIGLPLEERQDLEATIRMMADIEPGRFRWAVFYPFPGTDIYRLCRKENLIDEQRMQNLDNFYEATPLVFPPEQDLFIRKLQCALPWYINAGTSFDSASSYQEEVDRIEALSLEDWQNQAPDFLEKDRQMSERMKNGERLHYSIRFIQVMAVRSDYREEEQELSRPARRWRSDQDQATKDGNNEQ